jgi:hypothetical protein
MEFVKVGKASLGYSGARGKMIHEQDVNSKISCQTRFKVEGCRFFWPVSKRDGIKPLKAVGTSNKICLS